MKRIIITLLMLGGIAYAQSFPPGYTGINARYDWLAGKFRALSIPAGTDTAFTTGQYTGAGAILIDTTGDNQGFYYRMNGRWNQVGTPMQVNLPIYLDANGAAKLNQASAVNDGYLSAADWTAFDLTTRHMKDTLPSLPAVVPAANKMLFAKQYLLGPASAISFYNAAWDANPYPIIFASPPTQNFLGGSRGATTRYLAGTFTGTQNVAIGEFSMGSATSASQNVAIGRSAGFNWTTATGNIVIGYNRTSTATATNTLDIGGWITGQSGWIKIGTGTPLQKLHVGGKLVVDTLTTDLVPDSIPTIVNGEFQKMAISGLPTILNIVAGTYSPTLTGTANVSSITAEHITYERTTDNRVKVTGTLNMTPVAASVSTTFTMSLPIPSAFTNSNDLGGLAVLGTGMSGGGPISPNIVDDVASFSFIPTTTNSGVIGFTFSYVIK